LRPLNEKENKAPKRKAPDVVAVPKKTKGGDATHSTNKGLYLL
jgi:hypothetical protein